MDERSDLIRRLRRAGIDGGTADWDDERLAAAGVEVALGGPGRYTLSGLAHKSRVNTGIARSVMQALGRPNPSRGERLFTDEDVELVRAHRQFVDAGLPPSTSPAASRRRPGRDGSWRPTTSSIAPTARVEAPAAPRARDRVRLYELQPS
jgi:hypothetical protein